MTAFLLGTLEPCHVTDADGTTSLASGIPVSVFGLDAALAAALFTDPDETIYTGTIATVGTPASSLGPPLLGDDETFPAPVILNAIPGLGAAFEAAVDSIFSPTVAPGVATIFAPLLADLEIIYFLAITRAGVKELRPPPKIQDAETIFGATVQPGSVNLQPGLVADDEAVHAADTGCKVLAGLIADPDAVFSDITITKNAVIAPDVYVDGGDAETYPFKVQQLTGGIPVPREGITLTGSFPHRVELTGSLSYGGKSGAAKFGTAVLQRSPPRTPLHGSIKKGVHLRGSMPGARKR